MRDTSSDVPYDEVVVSLLPAVLGGPEQQAMRSSDPEAPRSYDALIYAAINGPWHSETIAPPPGQPDRIRSLPLAGRERLDMRWDRYWEYRSTVAPGSQPASALSERLIGEMSPGLRALLAGEVGSGRPVRVWWFTRAHELGELPWELVVHTSPAVKEGRLSFVRGRPRGLTPSVSMRDRLRLAFLHSPDTTPDELNSALASLPPSIEVVPMTGPPRAALARAVGEGFELVHLVATGRVSLGFDGIIEAYGRVEESFAPGELSRMLRGSRISVLGLTPATTRIESERGENLPPREASSTSKSVSAMYRAFTYLGSSQESLPTVIAPLAPLAPGDLHRFWSTLYGRLAETLSVEDAIGRAQAEAEPLPVALFLRHRFGQQFVRLSQVRVAGSEPEPDPTQLSSELQISRELLEQVRGINVAYADVEDQAAYAPLIDDEVARQGQLENTLSTWRNRSEAEQ